MTDQSDAAAARSAGEPEGRQRLWPVVEIAPDVWRLRGVLAFQAEIAALKAERDAALAEVEKLSDRHIWVANYIRVSAEVAALKAEVRHIDGLRAVAIAEMEQQIHRAQVAEAEVARLRAGNSNNGTKDQGE